MLLAGHLFRENQNAGELILDNNGHADFGGEVERVLNMADGCL